MTALMIYSDPLHLPTESICNHAFARFTGIRSKLHERSRIRYNTRASYSNKDVIFFVIWKQNLFLMTKTQTAY
ncbi:hypothetical protein B0O99DRAFT_618506 [Bisporella sp. PMI_857]|nr:hypothetical protein B0O99DRAFT_618506 [Bisporella sp. PMI_857]